MSRLQVCGLYSSIFRGQKSQHRWRCFKDVLFRKCTVFGRLFMTQCEFIAAQRVRRTTQICALYSRLYSERSLKSVVSKFRGNFSGNGAHSPLGLLLAATFFKWETERIPDEEFKASICELNCMSILQENEDKNVRQQKPMEPKTEKGIINNGYSSPPGAEPSEDWELVIKQENMMLWRKPIPDSYLYEYKVYGRFFDLPARAFFQVQMDIEYRKKWDKLVLKLEVVDQEEDSGSEVIHWVMHYPYPMYSRDYVYIRRHWVDESEKAMVLISQATNHPSVPETDKYVRVTQYSSKMVIRAHQDFEQNGFDYMLTYFDDPQAMFPSQAYNWMASSGVPDFVNKLHVAAKTLNEERKNGREVVLRTGSGVSPNSNQGQVPAYA